MKCHEAREEIEQRVLLIACERIVLRGLGGSGSLARPAGKPGSGGQRQSGNAAHADGKRNGRTGAKAQSRRCHHHAVKAEGRDPFKPARGGRVGESKAGGPCARQPHRQRLHFSGHVTQNSQRDYPVTHILIWDDIGAGGLRKV